MNLFLILKKFILLMFIGLFVFLTPMVIHAESELNFYVQPIFSESQLDGSDSYFDMTLPTGKREVMGLSITNTSNEQLNIKISVHTAYTNTNGVVEYGKDAKIPDTTLPHLIEELVEIDEYIILEAGEATEIPLTINMPEKSVEGLLAGGIRIEEIDNENKVDDEKKTLSITNKFSYVLGIVVSNDRSKKIPEIDLLDVFADQLNYRNVFSAVIQNPTSTFVNQLSVEATIRSDDEDRILYKSEKEGMQMAPNSNFRFPIQLEGDRFKNGSYVLNMTAKSGDQEWSWEQNFIVTQETARQFNQEDVTVDMGINWQSIFLITIGIFFLSIIVYSTRKKLVFDSHEL